MKIPPHRLAEARASASTWNQFVAAMQVNQAAIQQNFDSFVLTQDDKAVLERLPVTDVLVLAHDWCGDVVANLPLFAKIEAETGRLRLHIVPKNPDNVDIGLLYPHADGDVHIPIYVFFDAEGREKGHFIERTPDLTTLLEGWIAGFWTDHPELGPRRDFGQLEPEVRSALLAHLGAQRTTVREQEKASILELLSQIL